LGLSEALIDLQALTERLRRECPWDREQTERTIVPHTVEEAYEVADAALAGDDEKLLDELGDLLFQVYFLALLLEERGRGDLEGAARVIHQRAKAVGFEYPDLAGAVADLDDELRELKEDYSGDELGDVLFAAVNVARKLDVDPELELRRATARFRNRVEIAEGLARANGEDWSALPLDQQDRYFDLAKERAE
jgi:uncharacterized protein YabN with tetrapyrrole methylase and pyrophosphatase domain